MVINPTQLDNGCSCILGVFEIIRGYFNLKRDSARNEQELQNLTQQIDELKRQTTQFEFQTQLMNEHNRIIDGGLTQLLDIFSQNQEAQEELRSIERQKRLISIRPFLQFRRGMSNPREFSVTLVNSGQRASNIRIVSVNTDAFNIRDITGNQTTKGEGEELVLNGFSRNGNNMNLITGQFLLGYEDADGNGYRQNIIKNRSSYQIEIPRLVQE